MKRANLAIVVGVIAAVMGSVQAQTPPWGTDPNWTSYDHQFTMSVALADLDNDGYLDLVTGNYKYPYNFNATSPAQAQDGDFGAYLSAYRWIPQNGGYSTTAGPTQFGSKRCIDCIAIADYNKDNKLDIAVGAVVGKGYGGVWVYKNQGD